MDSKTCIGAALREIAFIVFYGLLPRAVKSKTRRSCWNAATAHGRMFTLRHAALFEANWAPGGRTMRTSICNGFQCPCQTYQSKLSISPPSMARLRGANFQNSLSSRKFLDKKNPFCPGLVSSVFAALSECFLSSSTPQLVGQT